MEKELVLSSPRPAQPREARPSCGETALRAVVQLLLLSGAKNSLLSVHVQLRARQGDAENSQVGEDMHVPKMGTDQGDRSREGTVVGPAPGLWSSLPLGKSLREERGLLLPVLLGANPGMGGSEGSGARYEYLILTADSGCLCPCLWHHRHERTLR